jgi:hypothetical protein
MRLLPFILFTFLNPQDSLWQKAYDNSDFVGLVRIHKEESYSSVEIVKVWKNNFTHEINLSIGMSDSLDDAEEYLIFSSNGSGDNWYVLKSNEVIKPIKKVSISKEMLAFLESMPCIDPDETLVARQKNTPNGLMLTGACYRGAGLTICGCNGKTYASPCESHTDGVMKYTTGPCPK